MNKAKSRRIVIISTMPPLPFGHPPGGRGTYVLLKGLVQRGHQVTMLVPSHSAEQQQELVDMFPVPEFDLRAFPVAHDRRSSLTSKWQSFRQPCSYVFSKELRREAKRVLAEPWDVLHLDDIWSGWLGMPCDRRKAVLNYHNLFCIDDGRRLIGSCRNRYSQWMRRRAEFRLARAYPNLLALTPRLAEELRAIAPDSHVDIVPLGIDPANYTFRPSCDLPSKAPTVSVIGTMRWYPSFSAAERLLSKLWPEIKKHVPEARCQVVGWGAKSALQKYLGMKNVEIAENVPDIRPYFDNTDVLLYAPGRGSGMKVKVMESFAFGIPVVTTQEGVEGLPAEDGIHAGICDDDEGLIVRTIALLRDRSARERQRHAARRMLEQHCGPNAILDRVEHYYDNLDFRQGHPGNERARSHRSRRPKAA